MEQGERNREYGRETELHRKYTRFRISDENEQIQHLQTEVKRLNEQCYFLTYLVQKTVATISEGNKTWYINDKK